MNSSEYALAEALRERHDIIADAASRQDPERHLERLKAISEKIGALSKSLPPPVDPRLAHYLERCSFDKALEALNAQL